MLRLPTILTFSLLGSAALAQLTPVPSNQAPAFPTQPPTLLPVPRQAATPSNLPGQEDLVPMQFPNTEVKDLLGFYERLTRKVLVYDNQVIGQVNLVLSQPVPKDVAIQIIEINLLLNGFTLVPVENTNIVKVIGIGKNPRSAAIPLIADELLIPEGEHVITFLAKLKYGDATEVAQALGTFIQAGQSQFTSITALPKAGALLITENTAMIRQILRVIREIDIPPAEVLSKFFELERGDAEDVQKKLEDILTKNQQGQAQGTTAGGGRPATPAARIPSTADGQPVPPGTPADAAATTIEITAGGPNEENIIQGKIKITADKRTNRIHVVTRPANMEFIAKLIREFDANVKFGEPSVRPLKYVSASDVLKVAIKAISDPGAKEDGSGAGGAKNSGSRPANGNQGSVFGNSSNSGTDAGGGGGGGGDFNVSEGLSTESIDTAPEAVNIGNTRIIADKRANSIIVIGSEDVKQKLFRVIDELDKRAPQVMFHVIIGELNLDETATFGVDYIIRQAGLGNSPILLNPNTGTGTGTSTGTGTGTGIGTGTGVIGTTDGTGTTTANNGNLFGFNGNTPFLSPSNLLNQRNIRAIAVGGASGFTGFIAPTNTLSAVVTALQNTNRFRVVSRPSVFTSNLKKAIIASGQEIAVPTNIQSGFNGGSNVNGNSNLVTNSSVQFKRVALQLEVVPLINSEREVDLDILQKNDEVSGSTRIDNNDIPTIATRYVKTHVTVPNQGTLILGGLIKSTTDRSRTGIPILSDIPVLGYLFSTTRKRVQRQELVILIRPEVSWTKDEDIATRERSQEFYNMPPDLEATVFPKTTRSRSAPEPAPRKLVPAEATSPTAAISAKKRVPFRE